ncbi:MAG: DUF2961 domain-containing protein, partial [bacterium]
WWGEGDDMIWVDGYKWPPELHGTGSEDYLNQAWGMQPNAFLRNGSSIHENNTGGYQTSYVHHLENPVRFEREIKVTIEHGHGNHLGNEMASVAYWYAETPAAAVAIPPVAKRQRVPKINGKFEIPAELRWSPQAPVTTKAANVKKIRADWAKGVAAHRARTKLPGHSPFLSSGWQVSRLTPAGDVTQAAPASLAADMGWQHVPCGSPAGGDFVNVNDLRGQDGIVYIGRRVVVEQAGEWILHVGHDGGARVFVDGLPVAANAGAVNPAPRKRTKAPVKLDIGEHEIVVALNRDGGKGWGMFVSFAHAASGPKKPFPQMA